MASGTGLTGAAGEYYVAAELSRRQWLATVTIKNAPGTDVLAQRLDRTRVVAVQTKTASPNSTRFRVSPKEERPGQRDDEWFVLVALREPTERPAFYVVPQHVIAAMSYLEHRDWLSPTGLLHSFPRPNRPPRQDKGQLRAIHPNWVDGYRDRWDLLDHSAWSTLYLGHALFLDLEQTFGLPQGHRPLRPQ